MKTEQFIAVRAFIVCDGEVLILRESEMYEGGSRKGKWDFPGGKIEPGEHFTKALQRETLEESGLEITTGRSFYVDEWRPNVDGKNIQIIGIFFECSSLSRKVVLGADHDKYLWMRLEDYKKYDLGKENRSAVEEYLKYMTKTSQE